MLMEDEIRRYERQIRIFGEESQEKIKAAKIFLAGVGGLGCAISLYLAASGIGRIRIVDHDVVDLTNMNRQVLYSGKDIATKKAESAKESLKEINPNIEVEAVTASISVSNIDELIGDLDVIIDAMDNLPTRLLLNKAAFKKNIPLFHGAVQGFYGQATTIIPGKTACLRCLFPKAPYLEPPPIIGVTCGVIGCIQATETIKYILGLGSQLENRLLIWDGLNSRIEEIVIERNPCCEDCGV